MEVSPLSKLQTRFFANDRVSFVRGKGGLILIKLLAKSSAQVEVYLHGGHITSFRDASGKELIYLSEKAAFTPSSSIRGGIPVCWPQFADLGSLPAHGLLRTSEEWQVSDCKQTKDEVSVVLTHCSTPTTLKLWPYSFVLTQTITLSDSIDTPLTQSITIENTGPESFDFTCALHSYYNIPDIHSTTVGPLSGVEMMDKVANTRKVLESDLSFSSETDTVCYGTSSPLLISCGDYQIDIASENFPDTVVWNLWKEKCEAKGDMRDEDWKSYLCVEAASVKTPVTLKAGEKWQGSQVICRRGSSLSAKV